MCNGFSYSKKINSNNNFINITRKMRYFALILLIFAFFILIGNIFNAPNIANAESDSTGVYNELEKEIDNIVTNLDFSGIDEILIDFNNNYSNYINSDNFKEFISNVIKGNTDANILDIWNVLKSSFLEVIKGVLSPLILIFVIVCLCNLLNTISSSKLSESIRDVIYFFCLALIVIIVSLLIKNVITLCSETITGIQKQINAIFPILLTLMTAIGATSSVSVYTPVLSIFSTTFINIFINILLPLFSSIVLIIIVSKLTKNNRLGKMNGFFSSLFKWVLGATCTIFMTFLSFQGITASTKDGLSIKAAKFAIKNYVPLLGGYLSDGFEIIKAGSVLVKNALGYAGIILLFFTLIKPISYLCILSLGLKLISGASDLIDNLKISSLLYDIANALKMLVAIVVGIACMYFFILFLCVCTGNVIM